MLADGPATRALAGFDVSVLSAFLIHYNFDHFLFLRIDGIITPSHQTTAQRLPESLPLPAAISKHHRALLPGTAEITVVITVGRVVR